MSDSVWISLISAASAIVVAFITVKYRNQTPRQRSKNRIDEVVMVYEKIIKGLDDDMKRKQTEIERQDDQITKLREELERRNNGI